MTIKYSIIIPTYNRANILDKCLQHICELDDPSENWEVLVMNNSSTDNTEDVIKEYQSRIPQLRYYNTKDPGLHIGRNIGCEKAKGEILCYIDDDSFVSKGWLKGIEDSFTDPVVVLVGGPSLPKYENEPPEWINHFWDKVEFGKCLDYLSLVDFGNNAGYISPLYVPGCNFNIRKKILLKIGGFHPDGMPKDKILFRGDGETFVVYKIMDLNLSALYSPEVLIHHYIPKTRQTIEYFCTRAFNQGISNSFRKIREVYGVENDKTIRFLYFRTLLRIIRRRLGNFRKLISQYKKGDVNKLKRQIRKNNNKGFVCHQKEFLKNPLLRKWVLRDHYWDYKLPDIKINYDK